MWELIRANKRNSILLMVLMAAVLLLLGFIIGLGFSGDPAGGFFGLMAPAGTPKAIIDKLHATVRDVTRQPDVRERLIQQGYEVHGSTPAEYAEYIRRQVERWTPVAKAAGIKPE